MLCKLPPAADPIAQLPVLILDTNVVLDWLVFADPSTAGFSKAITSAQVRWQVTAAFRDELAHVLSRGLRTRRDIDPGSVWQPWDAWSSEVPQPEPTAPAPRWRCSDPDDQKFIDLAVLHGARWLLSRDKAVLKLARKVQPLGLTITTPARWVQLAT